MPLSSSVYPFLLFLTLTLPALVFDFITLENFPALKICILRVGVILLVFGFLASCVWRERKVHIFLPSEVVLPLLFFLLFSGLSFINAENSVEWWGRFSFLLSCLFLFFAPHLFLREKGGILLFLFLLLLPSAVVSLYGLMQVAGYEFIFPAPRLLMTSTLGHINFVGQYLLTVTPLALAFLFLKSGPVIRTLCFLVLTLDVLCLGATYTRGAWLGFFAALACMFFLSRITTGGISPLSLAKGRRKLFLFASVFLFALPFSWFLATQPQVLRSAFTLSLEDVHPDKEEMTGRESWRMVSNNITRIKTWESTIEMIKDAPFLGVGLGNYANAYPPYRQWEEKEMETRIRWYAHNDYLQIAAEAGIPALLSFLLFLLFIFRRVVIFLRNSPLDRAEERSMVIGLSGCVIATLVHAFFSFNLYQPFSAPLFWFELGSVLLLTQPDTPHTLQQRGTRRQRTSPLFRFILLFILFVITLLLLRESIKRYHGEVVYSQTERIRPEHGLSPLIKGFTRATLINSDEAKYWYALGRAYSMDNNPEKAEDAYRHALELTPNVPAVRLQYARTLRQLGKIKKSEEELKHVLRIDPDDINAHNESGRLYYEQKRYKEAEKEFLAVEASMLRKQEGIAKHLIYDEEYNPAEAKQAMANLYYNLGNLYLAEKKPEKAEEAYQKGVASDTHNPLPLIGLGDIAQIKGDFSKAEKYYLKAIKIAPRMSFPRIRLQKMKAEQAVTGAVSRSETEVPKRK